METIKLAAIMATAVVPSAVALPRSDAAYRVVVCVHYYTTVTLLKGLLGCFRGSIEVCILIYCIGKLINS